MLLPLSQLMVLTLELHLQFPMAMELLEEIYGTMENGGLYTFQNGGLRQFQNIYLTRIALFTVKLVSCSSMSVAFHCFGFLKGGEDM